MAMSKVKSKVEYERGTKQIRSVRVRDGYLRRSERARERFSREAGTARVRAHDTNKSVSAANCPLVLTARIRLFKIANNTPLADLLAETCRV